MKLIIEPKGWTIRLEDCPPGFFVYGDSLFFKTEYGRGSDECFCDTGEYFRLEGLDASQRDNLHVQPVHYVWMEED